MKQSGNKPLGPSIELQLYFSLQTISKCVTPQKLMKLLYDTITKSFILCESIAGRTINPIWAFSI